MHNTSLLEKKITAGQKVITAEIFPPKGVDVSSLLEKARLIKPYIDAINVTDCQRSIMRISSLAVSKILIDNGIEPVYQLTCRDRNRIALQSDILGAYALGVRNILVISGDYPTVGDHPDAKPVYDLDTIQLIATVQELQKGFDLAGKKLKGAPTFFLGAAVNPSATPTELMLASIEKKVTQGVQFFQSQPIFDMDTFYAFKKQISHIHPQPKVVIGVLLLKSRAFAERIAQIPGMSLPPDVLKRLASAQDELKESIAISAEFIHALHKEADGIHLMAISAEEHIPEILEQAGIKP